MSVFEGRYFCTDASGGEINVDANDGITTDDDGGLQFDWDAQPTVSADKLPDSYTQFYDSDEFVKISDVTVAKPIKQQYRINGDEYTFEKTEGELRKAAWSFDNSPHPLTHPDSGRVSSVDDIHGFWKNPRYVDDEGVVSNLYLPANDSEALSYVSEHGDVSIGFTNRLVSSDEDGVDAIQTDIYGDHIASVRRGRCSGEDGCGLNTDSESVSSIIPMGDVDETTDNTIDTTMTDGTTDGCGCGDGDGKTIDFGDAITGMSVDALADRNDSVEELREEKQSLETDAEDVREELESVREALDADEGTDLSSELESLTERLDSLEEDVAEQYREEFDSVVSDIISLTDKTEDDFEFEEDSPEESVEKVRETKELLDSVEATPTDTDSTTDSTESTGGSGKPEVRYETQY